MRFFYIFLVGASLASSTLTATALDNTGMVPLLSFAVGSYNVQRAKRTAQFQIEYKTAVSLFMARPMVGAFMTSKSAAYIYAGIGWDLHFSRYLVVNLSFAPGVYFQGNDKNLGYPLEFRTAIEVAYKFKNKARLGVQFYHLSNASITTRNPGEESLLLYYSVPL